MGQLTPAQKKLLQQIIAPAKEIKDPKARKVYERAAAQTAIVESGISNPSGGDADSAGWRQERASLYSNPTNVRASAQRFKDEFVQHYAPGEKSYQVAAQVQRPAAQYAGRYHDVAKQASAALRQIGGASAAQSKSVASVAPTQRSVTTTTPGVSNVAGRQALLAQYLQSAQNPRDQTGALLSLAAGVQGLPDTPSTSVTSTVPGSGGTTGNRSAVAPTAAPALGDGVQGTLGWAESKLGRGETAGENRGKLPDRLNKKFGFGSSGAQPWCAMFTSTAIKQGGAPAIAASASVGEIRAKAKAKQGYRGFVSAKNARPGDLILFGDSHIGLVKSVSSKGINMIAGNDSDKVSERTVAFGAGDIVRPAYPKK